MSDQELARVCGRCGGRGTVVRTYDDYGMADPKDVPCPSCDGCGKVVPLAALVAAERMSEDFDRELSAVKVVIGYDPNTDEYAPTVAERALSAARADEREACAKVAEAAPDMCDCADRIAAAIRARGEAGQ